MPTILAIGRPEDWPEPLTNLATENKIKIECASNIHQAAARVRLTPAHYCAVLVDAATLSRHEWAMLGVLQHHISQPLWALPARGRRDQLLAQGILPWEEVVQALRHLQDHTPKESQGSKGISKVADLPQMRNMGVNLPADNDPAFATDKRAEMPVESDVATSYDQNSAQPLLSPHEIRALLGPE